MRVTAPPRLVVVYPRDAAMAIALLRGEVGRTEHDCGATVDTPFEAVVVDEVEGVAVGTLEPADLPAGIPDAYQRAGLEQLREHLALWMRRSTAGAVRNLARIVDASPAERLAAFDPVQIATFFAARSGFGMWATDDEDEAAVDARTTADLEEAGVVVTVDRVFAVVDVAAEEDLSTVIDAMARHIPSFVLDDRVLEAVRRVTHTHIEDPATHPVVRYRALLACAVAHELAGRPNPHSVHLTGHLVALVRLEGSQPDRSDDGGTWPAPSVLRRLIPAEAAVAGAAHLAREDGAFGPSVVAFLEKVGYPDVYDEIVEARVALASSARPKDDAAGILALRAWEGAREEPTGPIAPERLAGKVLAASAKALRDAAGLGDDFIDDVHRAACDIDETFALAFDLRVIEWANLGHELELARRCARRVQQGVAALDDTDLEIDALTEVGNTLRHSGDDRGALTLYEVIDALLDEVPEDGRRRSNDLNRAIVLRGLGRLTESMRTLDELAAQHPDDMGIRETQLATLYEVGGHGAGARLARAVLERTDLPPLRRRRFHRLLGIHLAAGGADQEALEHLDLSSEDHPPGTAARLEELFPYLLVRSPSPDLEARVDEVVQEIISSAGPLAGRSPMRAVTGLGTVALRAAATGRLDQLRRSLQVLDEHFPFDPGDVPWQVAAGRARLAVEDGDLATAATLARRAVAEASAEVPGGSDGSWSMTWVSRADLADLRTITHATAMALGGHERADLLAATFDMSNGREIAARAADVALLPSAGRSGPRLREVGARLGVDVVTVVEHGSEVLLLVQPATGGPEVVPFGSVAEAEAARTAVEAFDRLNPAYPEDGEALLGAWWALGGRFAASIRERLVEARPLIIIGGRHLAAVPFAAAGWPDPPLVEEREVSHAINHQLLVGSAPLPSVPAGWARATLACEKQGDSDAFVARLHAAGAASEGEVLVGRSVTRSTVHAALESNDEVTLLCHGLSSSHSGGGPSICVSAGGLLPPSLFPVVRGSDLDDFVVGWPELVEITKAPAVVVSLACSSGRSQVVDGGVRLGLEQGLVSRGSRHLVSPLWAVDQESSLEWRAAFVAADDRPSVDGVAVAHRRATLSVRERWPHPFHWAPFAHLVSYQGVPHE